MDDDELRYVLAEQVMVAGAICCLALGIGAAMAGLWIWPALVALGTAALASSHLLRRGRRWVLRGASLSCGASAIVWFGVVIVSGPHFEPTLVAIALLGAGGSGWAARFLHRAHRRACGHAEPVDAVSTRPAEDRYARGVIEELPATVASR